MTRLLPLLVALLLALPAHAIFDTVIDWDEVKLSTVVEGAPVAVSARVQGHTLVALVVTVHGKEIAVPKSELVGLPPHLVLRTIRVVSPDRKYPPGPTLRIDLEALPYGANHPPAAVAQFHFGNASYIGRMVEVLTSGKAVVREMKLLGQPVRREP